MTAPILTTKLTIPPPRPKIVARTRLLGRLLEGFNQTPGFARKLTLISAPAGFGKTTLLVNWIQELQKASPPIAIAWLSLDEGDNDPIRFLMYVTAALQSLLTDRPDATAPPVGTGMMAALQSPQPPPIENLLTTLLNEITALPGKLMLVLDDYHALEAQAIDRALAFLLEHQPPHMHLVIASREDPDLPLARLRVRGQLSELRVADLRFTPEEAAAFLNQLMGLNLSAEAIAALENRTEGWIAGLQLAALSLQGHADPDSFIQSFTGSHHFVVDYLLEEVLHQQPEPIQAFLLHTSILDRLCGPLCDAVLGDPLVPGQATLENLEHANLFILPLDNERRWYRYHRLFADLLRQRLQQKIAAAPYGEEPDESVYHTRASQWYEEQNLAFEAFQHAAAANDIERAARLIDGDGIPLHFRGAVATILDWLNSLPASILDEQPWLRWRYASLLLVNGQTTGVEAQLNAAETALLGTAELQNPEQVLSRAAALDDASRNLFGLLSTARATLALTRYDIPAMLTHSQRALAYLNSDRVVSRASANWTLGYAYLLSGDLPAARAAYTEAVTISQASGNTFTTILATIGLGNVYEAEYQLHIAAETFRRVLQIAGDQPLQIISEAHLGLARVLYEWNELEAAEQHGEAGLQLAQQYDRVLDRFIPAQVFLARLKLARGDAAGAAAQLAKLDQIVHERNFMHRMPEVAAVQVLVQLCQGDLDAAAELAERYALPLSQARVFLAQEQPAAALSILAPLNQQIQAGKLQGELFQVLGLHARALAAVGENEQALQILAELLRLAAPGGYLRTFLDEGPPMARLLYAAYNAGIETAYVRRLLDVFMLDAVEQPPAPAAHGPETPWIEPLSARELEVLQLIAAGLTNQEIADRLYLSLHTVKAHARNIYAKLDAKSRTQAVARAKTAGILSPE
ncbi:MAG: LuxR C-terminal-related transcriptional regulator [Anaerolineales bacterium]